jgi:hypothetical protein
MRMGTIPESLGRQALALSNRQVLAVALTDFRQVSSSIHSQVFYQRFFGHPDAKAAATSGSISS